ncbi:MAG TPA: hypothetical protein DEF34_07550 [Desulfotomaculum sp.]|nr:MAG: hypothetical protein VR67_11280 [Peptococcaceae bacterium BRH_c8a]KJS75890.1 MAG: hypothetical protein JL56_06530 [Desulfotomaculum sp. BICA1-6]HBX23466.1 hypothetical protein [Desulfotomaculum sp.]
MELGTYKYTNIVAIVFCIYMVIMLFIGWYSSKKITGAADYIVAGRRLNLFFATGTLFATWFCAGTMMGGAANAYLFGNQGVIFDPWGAALCLLLTGLFFARLMRRGGYMTLVDFFEIRYGREMGMLSTAVIVIAESGWVGAQLVAFGAILQMFLGLPLWVGILVSCVVLVAYTYMGGMWSVTLTDVVQMIILSAGLLILLPAVISHVGGWSNFIANASNWAELPAFAMGPAGESGYLGYIGLPGWFYYAGAWLAIGLGSIPAQDLMQRVLSSKDEKTAVRASYLAALLYVTIGMIPVIAGIAMFELMPELGVPDTEMILPWLAINFLPPILTAIFVAGLVAALMSSSDSALLAASAVIGYNGLRYFKPDASEKDTLRLTRMMVPVVAIASLLLALYAETIYRLMVIAWSVILVGLVAPYVGGYFWKKSNKPGALAAMAGGFLSWIAFIFYYLPATSEANVGIIEEGVVYTEWAIWDAVYIGSVPAFIVSIIMLVVVSLLTQKSSPPMPLKDMDGNVMPVKNWFGGI